MKKEDIILEEIRDLRRYISVRHLYLICLLTMQFLVLYLAVRK